MGQMGVANVPSLAAMEQTRMLAHTLAQNNDPKFQVTSFYSEIHIDDDIRLRSSFLDFMFFLMFELKDHNFHVNSPKICCLHWLLITEEGAGRRTEEKYFSLYMF